MHIALIADPDNFHTQKWAYGLKAEGASVTVFSFSEKELPHIPCVQIIPRFTRNGQLTYASYLGSADRLRRAITASPHPIDLLNAINVTPFGVWAARAQCPQPLVNMAMGADILEYPPPTVGRTLPMHRRWDSKELQSNYIQRITYAAKWQLFRRAVHHALHASDLILGDNWQLVHAVRGWFNIPEARAQLNRWGIDESLFHSDIDWQRRIRTQWGIRSDQHVILSARGLKPVYQADVILDAIEQVLQTGRDDLAFVVLSAGYDVTPELEAQAQRLHHRYPSFHYQADRMSREEVCQLWQMVDAFINVPVYDGFSNSLTEGRYVGAIPILNDIPAHKEVAEAGVHAYYVEEPFNVKHLVAAIVETANQVDRLRHTYGPINQSWVLQHAHLQTNIRQFMKQTTDLLGISDQYT